MRPIMSKKSRNANHLSGADGAAFAGVWAVSEGGRVRE
jgi:hypothetical protein